ncbi:MAG: EexN family lipoprotein [Acidiphilium sp.]
MRTAIILILACIGLAGCGDGTAAYYNKHPHDLMRDVVACENNGGALANTPHCRKVLQINQKLF